MEGIYCEKIGMLKKRGIWEIQPRPAKQYVLSIKLVLRIKRNPDGTVDWYKARLVACGNLQREMDYNALFSGLVDFTTIRTALVLAEHNKEIVRYYDVISAFVRGK